LASLGKEHDSRRGSHECIMLVLVTSYFRDLASAPKVHCWQAPKVHWQAGAEAHSRCEIEGSCRSTAERMCPEAYWLNFSKYQSGLDLKCSYSNHRPLKPLTTFIGVWQGLFSGT
jgi:hypothetical protein